MGQTLTHGIYLPDEGERNCYAGLAANWQLLDGAVGTVAEHTTALAGKAPAVHTHTKSDITDFPAYGNTAGTICEGNDSRLSDARTPVAHTHGKADITDLFNSANTWTGSQTFTENSIFSNFITSKESAAIPASGFGKGIVFRDYQNNRLGYIQPYVTSDSENRLLIGNDAGNIVINSRLIPYINSYYDLGTSTNKWKSFNGVNPGALSLPGNYSSRITVDLTNWVFDGTAANTYTPPSDGWLNIRIDDIAGAYIEVSQEYKVQTLYGTGARSDPWTLSLLVPVRGGLTATIKVDVKTGIRKGAYFYPCPGNV